MVDGFSCILDFSKFSGGVPPDPLIKGIHQLNPQNLSSTTTAAKGEKELESPPPLNQSTRTLSLGYTEIRTPSPIKTIYKNFIFRLYRN